MFSNLGLDGLMFRVAPKLRLKGFGFGIPDLMICPDILLAGLVVAFVAAVYAIYQAIITKGKKRRRKRSSQTGEGEKEVVEAFWGEEDFNISAFFSSILDNLS